MIDFYFSLDNKNKCKDFLKMVFKLIEKYSKSKQKFAQPVI